MHPKEKMGVESSNAKLAYQTSIENGVDGKGSYRGKSEVDGNVFVISEEGLSNLTVDQGKFFVPLMCKQIEAQKST
jgi:hypothetical protein